MIPKFRAWDKRENTMRDVAVLHFTKGGKVNSIEYWKTPSELKSYHVRNLVLMQSTGLKDKNGMEIFEGDVVRYTWDMLSDVNATEKGKKVRISKVFWSDWRASWAVGKKSCNNDLFRYARNGNTVEVIGNVWEDGDLLDDNKETECNRAY